MTGGMDEIRRNADRLQARVQEASEQAADEIAQYLADYAKGHHRWHPISGNTDTSTIGTSDEIRRGVFRIVLSAGMDYDKFLELAHSGAYAWLWPAIVENQAQIIEMWQRRMTL